LPAQTPDGQRLCSELEEGGGLRGRHERRGNGGPDLGGVRQDRGVHENPMWLGDRHGEPGGAAPIQPRPNAFPRTRQDHYNIAGEGSQQKIVPSKEKCL
jgi:hypothetical protein